MLGIHALNMDGKGRIAVPSRYREVLAARCQRQFVITIDLMEPCLLIYPFDEWKKVENELVRLPTLNPKTKRFQRLFLGHASECEMDAQGRLLVPQLLREYASLDKRLVLVGQVNKFELWPEQVWQQKRKELLEQDGGLSELPEELGSLIL